MKPADLREVLKQGSVFFNRLELPEADIERLRELDPNGRAPLTLDGFDNVSPEAQREFAKILAGQPLHLAQAASKDTSKRRSGRSAVNVAKGDVVTQADARKIDEKGARSTHNVTELLLSDALSERGDADNYMTQLLGEFERAKKFIAFRAFELSEEMADVLIQRAKAGIVVEGLVQPISESIRPEVQSASMAKIRAAMNELPNLRVSEAEIHQRRGKPFRPIMHIKEYLTDGGETEIPTRLLAGINAGNNSPNNVDHGRRTRGVAAVDALRRFLSSLPEGHEPHPALVEAAQDIQGVQARVEAFAKEHGLELVPVTVSGSGTSLPRARSYSREELLKAAELGTNVTVSVEDALENLELLQRAADNHSVVTVVHPEWWTADWARERMSRAEVEAIHAAGEPLVISAADALEFSDLVRAHVQAEHPVRILLPERLRADAKEAERETLMGELESLASAGASVSFQRDRIELDEARKALGALTRKSALLVSESEVLFEESSRKLLYDRLDRAVKNQESIEMGAFALTDVGVLERMVKAHLAGSLVRVIVDDLTIDDNFINRKAVHALTAMGIEVRIFDDAAAKKAAKSGVDPELVKLHGKGCLIGRLRGDGQPLTPHLYDGTSNFSDAAHSQNTEAVELVESEAAARKYHERLYEPAWEMATPVERVTLVDDALRKPILEHVPMDTPIKDVVFAGWDTETTGFAPHFGDSLTEVAGVGFKAREGKAEVIDGTTLETKVDPGFEVPKPAQKIHGMNREKLLAAGAVSEGKGLAAFVEWLEGLQQHGPTLSYGQNIAFDYGMADRLLQKQENAVCGVHRTVDGPCADSIDRAKRAFPEESYHNLDVLVTRDYLVDRARKGENITVCAADAAGAYMSVLAEAMSHGAHVTLVMESGPRPVEVGEGEPERMAREEVPPHKLLKFNQALEKLEALAEEGKGTLTVIDTWSEDPDRPHLSSLSAEQREASFIDFPHLDAAARKRALGRWIESGLASPRENHEALEDVTLGAAVFARLIHEAGAEKVADIMPRDDLLFPEGATVPVYARAGSKNRSFTVQTHNEGMPRLHSGKDKDGQRISGVEVHGVEKGRLKVTITTGTGKKAVDTEAFLDPADVRFKTAGEHFFRLREAGIELAAPSLYRDGETFDPHPPAKRAA